MRLYFLRHAIAVEREAWTGEDSERPLTDEGREQMHAAARGLAALDLRLDGIYTSPFVRAADTAKIVAAELGHEITVWSELASGCDLDRLAPQLATLAGARAVMLVGHEPDFSAMIGRLIGANSTPARINLKKGACCRVNVSLKAISSGERRKLTGAGELSWLLTPELLARMAPIMARSNGRIAARSSMNRPRANNNSTTHTPHES